jgi:O-methyltransferase
MDTDNRKVHKSKLAQGPQKPIMLKLFKKMRLAVFLYRKGHVYCPEQFVRKALKLVGTEEVLPFGDMAREVISHKKTMLDYDRLYSLYQAIISIKSMAIQDGSIAEVGVYKGGSTYFIAMLVEKFIENKTKIFAIDTFEGHAKNDIDQRFDGPHTTEKFTDTSFHEVSKYLSVFENVVVYKGRFQDQCAQIQGESFSFVHVDVDIYEPTVACLNFFSSRLKTGGIIIVDDYGYKTCEGAKKAVDEFMDLNHRFIKFHLTTGQCLIVKIC